VSSHQKPIGTSVVHARPSVPFAVLLQGLPRRALTRDVLAWSSRGWPYHCNPLMKVLHLVESLASVHAKPVVFAQARIRPTVGRVHIENEAPMPNKRLRSLQ